MADENPMALRMAKTALIALLLLLNCDKSQNPARQHFWIEFTLLERQERLSTVTLSKRFITATPVNTRQGRSVIVARCGTLSRGWPGLFWAFPNIMTAVKIRENEMSIMRMAATRM
jgi:hypothetical protein